MFVGIQNKEKLATTPLRRRALDILETGYEAIDTKSTILDNVTIGEDSLTVNNHTFSLEGITNIHVIGFGKAACEASIALEEALGGALSSGVAIDVDTKTCNLIETFAADHPKPTTTNVEATEHVVELADSVGDEDLVIVTVSGGGSALLCWPEDECRQSQAVYEAFLEAGATIQEINTVRKHLSELKGGGLAKHLYPASVIGLIFSDVPGGDLSDVASGPTFYDASSIKDARDILQKYSIDLPLNFYASPKEQKYFQKVSNIPLITNSDALETMAEHARQEGFTAGIVSRKMYDFPSPTIERLIENKENAEVSLGGGEIRLVVDAGSGSGGRNQHLVNEALNHIEKDNELFLAAASDGIDNTDAAGAIVDTQTLQKIEEADLDFTQYLADYNSFELFQETNDLIYTGSTGANVADIMMYISHD